MVISELIYKIKNIIGDASETALLDARMIVSHITGLDNVSLVTKGDMELEERVVGDAVKMAEDRAYGKPMAYIIGSREFMSLEFMVSPGVLIPRPDTECIVEKALELSFPGCNLLDIGTGSGSIALSIGKYKPECTVSALDYSEDALICARKNAELLGVDAEFIKADIFRYDTDKVFDIIVSNPPYIETDVIETLQDDVKKFEPMSALDGGEDGLDFYKRISEFSFSHLNEGGYLIYEFGWKQHDLVKEIIEANGFLFIETIYDLSGIKRGLVAKK